MTHPSDRFAYSTFMDAVIAGAEKPTFERMDDWVSRWHEDDASEHAELHEALGLTREQYATIVPHADAAALAAEVAARRDEVNGALTGPVNIRFGVPAAAQAPGLIAAGQTDLDSGHTISIAMSPPKDLYLDDHAMLRSTIASMARRFADSGWTIDIQVGPQDAKTQ